MATEKSTTITAHHGETRRLTVLVIRKASLGIVLTLAVQNFAHLPGWLAFAQPVAGVLGLHYS